MNIENFFLALNLKQVLQIYLYFDKIYFDYVKKFTPNIVHKYYNNIVLDFRAFVYRYIGNSESDQGCNEGEFKVNYLVVFVVVMI